VLREAAVMPNTNCVGCGSEPRNDELAGAETVLMVERKMCNAVMRGTVVPPGSRATSRANRSRRNLGYLASGRQLFASAVRIGKARSLADDARAREVALRHSSCEVDEQSGAIRCGAGGAKGGDQGELRKNRAAFIGSAP
jgi:hypothetical protein